MMLNFYFTAVFSTVICLMCLCFRCLARLFPSLTTLSLPNCPHIDDAAWTSLVKKTRRPLLRHLNLSIPKQSSTTAGTGTGTGVGRMRTATATSSSAADNNRAVRGRRTSMPQEKGRFTDYGLKLLVSYCPSLTSLNVSGQSFLSAGALRSACLHLTQLQYLSARYVPIDGKWLQSLVHLSRPLLLTLDLSLTHTLMRSAPPMAAESSHASGARDESTSPSSSHSSSPSPSSPHDWSSQPAAQLFIPSRHSELLRVRLAQQIERWCKKMSEGRIILQLMVG